MTQQWEYRVKKFRASGDDEGDSQVLTNIGRPSVPEQDRADGWEIFAVQPADNGVRLYMKRPKPDQ